MSEDFTGKVVLVTGAGSGIGRATAMAFARAGARVAVSDVDAAAGEQTVHYIRETGGEARGFPADVSKAKEVEALVRAVVETWGRLDCAHNNAGIAEPRTPLVEMSEETFDRVIAINLKGVWLCMKHEIAYMLRGGGGTIVNTSSVVGLAGVGYQAAYVASKHGIIGLTQSAALEHARSNIRINAVCPGAVRTPAIERFIAGDPQVERYLTAQHPMGRLGTPNEIAAAVLWLSSDAASFVTGHALAADGGVLAQ